MISPVKTLIANLTDRPARLYLRGRSLYVISSKGMPGSVVEVEGDVFSRIENNTEAEFFLEQVMNGYLAVSYSVDERFVCSGCIDNTNMNLPAKFIDQYRGVSKEPVQEVKQEPVQEVKQEVKQEPVQEVKQDPVQEVKQEPVQEVKQEVKQEPVQETIMDSKKEAFMEKEETLSDIANKSTDNTTEDKPKKTRKIKVQ